MRAILEVVAFATAMHRPVVAVLRHEREHLRVDIVGEDTVKFEMEERLLDCSRGIDRSGDRIRETCDQALAVVLGKTR